MKKESLSIETIATLESLYASYIVLENTAKNCNVSEGIFTIYERILSILKQDDIYSLIFSNLGDIFEDYINNVSSDTPQIIKILKEHIGTCKP